MFDHIKKIAEDIEGLPKSSDPYAPSAREFDKELGETPSEDLPEDLGKELKDDLGMPGLNTEPGMPGLDTEPEMPFWEPIETNNKKDIAFKRSDGFTLRARQYKSVPGKWIAQLYSKDKLLNWGNLFIPADMEPDVYLQKMSDYMLDKDTNRYEQKKKSGLGVGPGEEEIPLEKELMPPGADEDIGLDDENIDLEPGVAGPPGPLGPAGAAGAAGTADPTGLQVKKA